jgi:hypothetical protein
MRRSYPIFIGLDHNYIIRLAETAVALHRGGAVTSPWDEILTALHRRVQVSGEVACPASPFTDTESRHGGNVVARNESASREFSGGYKFRHWTESMRFQTSNRVRAISGRGSSYSRPPSSPRDPYLFLERRREGPENGLDKLCFRIAWAADHDRQALREMQAVARHLALGRAMEEDARMIPQAPRAVGFVEQFLRDAVEFGIVYRAWVGDDSEEANARLIPTYRAMYTGVPYAPLSGIERLDAALRWEHPNPRYVDNEFIKVARGELPLLPTPQIWGTLMSEVARDRMRNGGRRSGNDVYDILRAATAIPVVKAYATDRGIRGLLDRTGVAAEYHVTVYGARRGDPERFLRDLQTLTVGKETTQ